MESVQRNTNAWIIFTVFYAIPSKVFGACLTENNDYTGGYRHFLFNFCVLELQFLLSVIERCVLPFGPLTPCAPHQQCEAFCRAPRWYIHVPIGRLWQAGYDIMVVKKMKAFLPGSALSPGLQLRSCECIWVYNLRAIWNLCTLHKPFDILTFVSTTVFLLL